MRSGGTAAPVRHRPELNQLAEMDRLLLDLADALGAEERQYPILIARQTLERAEYPRAFPHLLFTAAPLRCPEREPACLLERDNLATPCWCLSPAVCYH